MYLHLCNTTPNGPASASILISHAMTASPPGGVYSGEAETASINKCLWLESPRTVILCPQAIYPKRPYSFQLGVMSISNFIALNKCRPILLVPLVAERRATPLVSLNPLNNIPLTNWSELPADAASITLTIASCPNANPVPFVRVIVAPPESVIVLPEPYHLLLTPRDK